MPQRWERVRQLGKQVGKNIKVFHVEKRLILLDSIRFEINSIKTSFPPGTFVWDFRLAGTDIPFGDVGVVPDERVASYKWEGKLPSRERLEQIARQQSLALNQRPNLGPRLILYLIQWGTPLLLIAIGGYWWWRTRRQ